MKKLIVCISVLSAFVFLAACTAEPEPTPTEEPEPEVTGIIVMGDIDADDPVSKIEEFQPIVDYLAENLNDAGIGIGEVKIAPDTDTMISMAILCAPYRKTAVAYNAHPPVYNIGSAKT